MGNFKAGDRVKVPSGLGGVWCGHVVDHNTAHGIVQVKVDNTQYPEMHGKILIEKESDVKHDKR